MHLKIEFTKDDLKKLVMVEIERRVGDISLSEKDIKIETRSTQNYKSEWEIADFRAVFEKGV